THFCLGDLNAALVADHATVFHALVLSAQAFPVRDRPENARAEEPVALRLEGAVIDRLWFGHFPVRPVPNFFGRRQRNTNSFKVRSQLLLFLLESKHVSNLHCRLPTEYLAVFGLWSLVFGSFQSPKTQ